MRVKYIFGFLAIIYIIDLISSFINPKESYTFLGMSFNIWVYRLTKAVIAFAWIYMGFFNTNNNESTKE